jgi:2,5-diamino-6-(ribosylamino)-4(3H)-pyrimidinone 5'-phosphate reductase
MESRFLTHGPARVIVFTPLGVDVPAGIETYALGTPRVDLSAALGKLAELGIQRLLVEGGATLNFELLRLGLVDELQIYVAPLVFGGATAPSLADGAGLGRESAVQLRRLDVQTFEDGGLLLRYALTPQVPRTR